jgi:hypothetical protein
MVPAGYQLPNNWRLGGAVHLDPFLVNAGSESTAEADEDVAGNPSRERDGCYCNINVLGRSFRLTCLAV